MPRKPRWIEAGTIYHVLNRGNGRRMLFNKDADFAAFMKLLSEAVERFQVDLLSYCLSTEKVTHIDFNPPHFQRLWFASSMERIYVGGPGGAGWLPGAGAGQCSAARRKR